MVDRDRKFSTQQNGTSTIIQSHEFDLSTITGNINFEAPYVLRGPLPAELYFVFVYDWLNNVENFFIGLARSVQNDL